jgi:hypothetical protein
MSNTNHGESKEKERMEDERTCTSNFLKKLPSLLLIFIPMIALGILISKVASFSSDSELNIIQDATALSLDFAESSPTEINDYILTYWFDNMFIVAFGLFMAGLLNVVLLPKYVKLALYCTTIPGHPICDWIENTAAVMAFISFNGSDDQTVDEYWTKQYFIWSKVKWTFLAINAVAIIVGFSLSLRKRYCIKE